MMNWIKFSKQKVNKLLRNLYVNGKALVLFLGGESLHPSTKYAPLRSFRSLTELISRSTPRKYLLKSMLYGDPHQGISRIQSFTSAKLFGWDLRVTYIYCFDKHLNKFFANKPFFLYFLYLFQKTFLCPKFFFSWIVLELFNFFFKKFFN